MAKTDKSDKKSALKRSGSTKGKVLPPSSKEILEKAASPAQATPKVRSDGKKTSPVSLDNSSGSTSAEESSSGESDSSEETPPPKKKSHSIKEKPAIPLASKQNPVKPASSSKSTSTKAQTDGKNVPSVSSDSSSGSSSAEESSSGEGDDSEEASPSTKLIPDAVKRAVDSSDDSSTSQESSGEDGDGDKKMAPLPAKAPSAKVKTTSGSEDDSSVASSSEESSSENDSSEGEDDKPSASAHTVSLEASKKRKADSEAVALPKKARLGNGSASVSTAVGETSSIFVGRLSWNVDSDWLAQEFAECGEVESAHVQMDRNTGRSRGFGYVHFKTTEAVEKALALDGKEIDGRAVHVDKSSPPDKTSSVEKRAKAFGDTPSPPSTVLFVGNLSFGVNEDTLWETFGEHGDVKNVRVPTDRDTGKPKGFAYVEFSEVSAAKTAHKALQGFELDGRSIRLDFSQPRDSAGGRGGQQGGRGGRGGRGRGGFGGDRGRGGGRGSRGGDRGRGARGRGARTGGITQFEGRKTTFE